MAYVLIFTFGFAQNLFLIHAKDGPHPLLAVPRNSWNKLERGPRYRFDFVSSGKCVFYLYHFVFGSISVVGILVKLFLLHI